MTDTAKKKVELDADVAEWINGMLFPEPETGATGVMVNGVPGTPEFEQAVDLFTRAKSQLGG